MKLHCQALAQVGLQTWQECRVLSWESAFKIENKKERNADIPVDASMLSASTQLCLTLTISFPKTNKYLRLDDAPFAAAAARSTTSSFTVFLKYNFICCHNFSPYVYEGLRPLKAITVSPHHTALSSSQTRHDRAINTPSHPIEHTIQKRGRKHHGCSEM